MRTHRVGTVDIDQDKLRHELEATSSFRFVEPYQEFVCGRPSRSVMLWAPGCTSGDGVIAHYDHDAEPGLTEYGRQLPYLAQVLDAAFSLRHLRFARLAVLAGNVLVPHRDYVEFDDASADVRPAHRLHVPLVTNPSCLFCEDDVVYRMAVGEVWFLDVTRVHGAAALSDEIRTHLILDFVDAEDERALVQFEPSSEPGIPASALVPRPPLGNHEREALHGLAAVVDEDNLRDVFGIVAKKAYRRDGGRGFFWRTIGEIRRRVPDPELRSRLLELEQHFLLRRDD